MQVLYATSGWTPHDRRFLRALVAQRHSVWYSSQETLDVELPDGVKRWPLPQAETQGWGAAIGDIGIEVVHAGPIPTVAARLAQHVDAPFVVMSWGSDVLVDAAQSDDWRAKALSAITKANAVIGDCMAIKSQIQEWLPALDCAYINFPWGIDLDRFARLPTTESRALRTRLGWGANLVLISTRSWEPNYGIDVLLKSFAEVVARDPRVRLILASDGTLRDSVRKLIVTLGISDVVHCPGRLDEEALPQWYGAADLYVSASRSDGSSVSLLEAMACALPVVVHDKYGNLEWVDHGKNGWLGDCTDASALSSVLLTAIANKASWLEMGRLGREYVWERADWSVNSKKITTAYECAVQHRYGRGHA
ncbi:MAG TPA: glycosyltransferase [Burkholderiales bacterium]|nr:glycosyltransferase [Burkholderiales bacterium]